MIPVLNLSQVTFVRDERLILAPLTWKVRDTERWLVLGANGEKLSKQNGAEALDLSEPLKALNATARVLGLVPAKGPMAAKPPPLRQAKS